MEKAFCPEAWDEYCNKGMDWLEKIENNAGVISLNIYIWASTLFLRVVAYPISQKRYKHHTTGFNHSTSNAICIV